eukprot:scaffold428_cov168-Ochromonas_danica.AAC.39
MIRVLIFSLLLAVVAALRPVYAVPNLNNRWVTNVPRSSKAAVVSTMERALTRRELSMMQFCGECAPQTCNCGPVCQCVNCQCGPGCPCQKTCQCSECSSGKKSCGCTPHTPCPAHR